MAEWSIAIDCRSIQSQVQILIPGFKRGYMSFKEFVKNEMPGFIWNWHHDVICTEIDKLLFDENENQPRNLMILAPPRSSKSTLCSNMLPGYINATSTRNIMVFSSSTAITQDRKRDFMRKF